MRLLSCCPTAFLKYFLCRVCQVSELFLHHHSAPCKVSTLLLATRGWPNNRNQCDVHQWLIALRQLHELHSKDEARTLIKVIKNFVTNSTNHKSNWFFTVTAENIRTKVINDVMMYQSNYKNEKLRTIRLMREVDEFIQQLISSWDLMLCHSNENCWMQCI